MTFYISVAGIDGVESSAALSLMCGNVDIDIRRVTINNCVYIEKDISFSDINT